VGILAVPCAIALVALAGAATVPAAGGCTTHACDPDCVRLGAPPDATCAGSDPGKYVHVYRNGDEIVWETSGSVFDKWLDYPGQRTYQLNWQSAVREAFPDVDLCTLYVVNVDSYIATDENGAGFVPAAGQLVEMTYPLVADDDAASASLQANGQVNVFNGTCAEYFLRVVVTMHVGDFICGCHGPCPDGGAGSPDAGEATVEAGADSNPALDAPGDVSVEAGADSSPALDAPGDAPREGAD
jgi:hypothetical protein